MSHDRNRKPRILIADDEYVISRCVTFMLKKEGYECHSVSDGEAAIEAMRADPPDLLILDLDMPRKNGFEVCRELRQDPALKDVHVLVLTAKGQPMTRDWRSQIEANSFMLKPFDPRQLLRYVEALFVEDEELTPV
jgi:DNA-binding response OmpR family regulator